MALDIPTTAEEVIQRSQVDVQRSIEGGIDPFNKNNVVTAIVTSNANRVFDFYAQLQLGIDESLPDTAEILLERWAAIFGKTQNAATQSVGDITITGTDTTILPVSTELADSTGAIYTVTQAATITAGNIVTASSLTRVISTATFVTATAHGLANNVPVTISGANEVEYNVTDAAINVIDAITFTYVVSGTPTTPATGTIIGTFTSSLDGAVESNEFGSAFNLASEQTLSLTTAITGIDNVVGILEPGFTGGTDVESNESLRIRMLDKIQNPVAHFNASDIIEQAKTVDGVTRVFVSEVGDSLGSPQTLIGQTRITSPSNPDMIVGALTSHGFVNGDTIRVTASTPPGYNTPIGPPNTGALISVINADAFIYQVAADPGGVISVLGNVQGSISPGTVFIYPMTDNLTANGIPSGATLTAVSDAIEIIKPANTATSDVNVVAAIPVPVDVTVITLVPNISTLITAVESNIAQFFREEPIISTDVTDESIIGAIQNTIDPVTGRTVESFTLTLPSGNVAIAPGQIAVEGVIAVS